MQTKQDEEPKSYAPEHYDKMLAGMISAGWVVTAEGPSGAQMSGGKQMRMSDKICLAIGILGLVAYGLGLILILIAVLDYAFFTKPTQHFLSRSAPAYPKGLQ